MFFRITCKGRSRPFFNARMRMLIFRYDSTPHFPEISTFPHHKHLPDDVIASAKSDIEQVIREAASH